MAETRVEVDYAGRPIIRKPITDADRAALTAQDMADLCDATATTLPDGTHVWRCWDGTFLEKDGQPDRSRPIDYTWPTLEELLAEADAAAADNQPPR